MRVADDCESEGFHPALAGLRPNDIHDAEIDTDRLCNQGRQAGFTCERQKLSSAVIYNVRHCCLHLVVGVF
jgi:hypothetical protein